MKTRVSKGRAAAKTPARKTSRRVAEKRPGALADVDTPLASGAAVAVLNALAPEAEGEEAQGDVLDLDRALGRSGDSPSGGRLPRLVPAAAIETCTMEELLLMAIAGEKGEMAQERPLEAISLRLAVELQAITSTTGLEADVAGDLIFHAAGRARVLAELIRRAGR